MMNMKVVSGGERNAVINPIICPLYLFNHPNSGGKNNQSL